MTLKPGTPVRRKGERLYHVGRVLRMIENYWSQMVEVEWEHGFISFEHPSRLEGAGRKFRSTRR